MGNEKSADDKQKHPDEKIFWFVAIGFITMLAAPGIYAYAFRNYDLGGPTDWGTFATYFSGIVTPIVALCSAVLFFRSIVVQRREFEETRREMRTGNRLQLEVETNRLNQKTQEQLERAIPIVRDLHRKLFSNLARWNKKGLPKDEQSTVHNPKNFLRWYSEKSIHLITMLDSYLNAGGDIYLLFDWLNALEAEWEEVDAFAKKHSLAEDEEYKAYLKLLDEISERRDFEVKNYEKRWG